MIKGRYPLCDDLAVYNQQLPPCFPMSRALKYVKKCLDSMATNK